MLGVFFLSLFKLGGPSLNPFHLQTSLLVTGEFLSVVLETLFFELANEFVTAVNAHMP